MTSKHRGRNPLIHGPRSICRCASTVALTVMLSAHLARAQDTNGISPSDQTYVLHQRVEEVLLYCTVIDHKGQLVTDLERPAFTVLEDKQLVTVTHFARKDVPVAACLQRTLPHLVYRTSFSI
jgi:hypothetical protein